MASHDITLDELLYPLRSETFVADYFEQRPLVQSRNDPDFYAGLLSLADVESLIFSLDMPENQKWLNVVKNGQGIPVSALLDEQKNYRPGMVMSQYQQGCTIVLNSLQRRWQPVGRLCKNLESVFSSSTHVLLKGAISANLYLTPRNAQGFAVHYDGYDTFILQLEGSKHWTIYDELTKCPLTGFGDMRREELGEPLHDISLHPGDFLYVPRGYPHEAATTGDYSMHLTLGLRTYTWADALSAMMKADDHFRSSLPFSTSSAPLPSLQGRLTDLVQRLCNEQNLQAEIERFAVAELSSMAPLPGDYLQQSNQLNDLTLETVVCKRYGQQCYMSKQQRLSVAFPGNVIYYPLSLEASLKFLIEHEQCSVGSIPGITKESQKLLFVQNLIGHGFLKIV